ncbi:hypothetical protein [Nonomuraea sp. NPDC003201]
MFDWPVNAIDETYALIGDDGGRPTGGIGQAGPHNPYTGIVTRPDPVRHRDAGLWSPVHAERAALAANPGARRPSCRERG